MDVNFLFSFLLTFYFCDILVALSVSDVDTVAGPKIMESDSINGTCQTTLMKVKWISTTPEDAENVVSNRAVVGGYEANDGGPLWVIRAFYKGHLIPGKLAIKRKEAYVTLNGVEKRVTRLIEVCSAHPDSVTWCKSNKELKVSHKAVVAGYTESGEELYIGRVKDQESLISGKVQVHANVKGLFVGYDGKEKCHEQYEYLCLRC